MFNTESLAFKTYEIFSTRPDAAPLTNAEPWTPSTMKRTTSSTTSNTQFYPRIDYA
jgi:hypothetical protein